MCGFAIAKLICGPPTSASALYGLPNGKVFIVLYAALYNNGMRNINISTKC
jgi:hypothetical protein